MSKEQQIQEIEQSIQGARITVELGNALARLHSNRDFKKVVLDGYFRDEAVRLVHLLSDPNMQTPDKQATILSDIRSIGALGSFFKTLEFRADLARKSIVFDEQTRDELTQGEEDGR